MIDRIATGLFRRHVSRGAQDGPHLGQVLVAARGARQAEIEDLHTGRRVQGSGFRVQALPGGSRSLGPPYARLRSLNPEPRTLNPILQPDVRRLDVPWIQTLPMRGG